MQVTVRVCRPALTGNRGWPLDERETGTAETGAVLGAPGTRHHRPRRLDIERPGSLTEDHHLAEEYLLPGCVRFVGHQVERDRRPVCRHLTAVGARSRERVVGDGRVPLECQFDLERTDAVVGELDRHLDGER